MKYNVTLNGKVYEVDVEQGEAVLVGVREAAAPAAAAPTAPAPAAPTAPAAQPAAASPAAPVTGDGEKILAPMPGTVVELKASAGAPFKKGDVLLVFEAMKMENEITAPRDGVTVQTIVSKGAAFNTDDVLLVIK